MERVKPRCEFEGCQKEAHFALYWLNEDFTKTWMNLCDFHDKLISQKSQRLRAQYPNARWVEHSK